MINIDDLVGIRYIPGGRDKNGYDCYGLAIEVCKRCGYELPEIDGAKRENFADYVGKVSSIIKVKKQDKPEKEGDLVIISDNRGIFSHIGVYLGDGLFIHCNDLGVHLDTMKRYAHFIGGVYVWQR